MASMQTPTLKTVAAMMLLLASVPGAIAGEGVTQTDVTFIQIAATSGSASTLGISMGDGIRAAFEEANQDGGVHGRQVHLDTIDDGYDPSLSIAALRKVLTEDQHLALVGATGTPTLAAMQPMTTEAKFPVIGPFTGAGFLRNAELGNVFNLRASYAAEAEEWARELVDRRGLKRIAIFFQDDSFGRAGRSGLVLALHKRGLAPVGEGTYVRNSNAVKSALIDIRRAKPDAVVMVAASKPLATFVKTAQSLDFRPELMAISFGADAIAKQLGAKAEGIMMTQVVPFPGSDDLAVLRQYHAALKAFDPKIEPSFVNLEGYLVGRLALRALEDAGPKLTRAKFLAALQALEQVDLGGLTLSFSKTDNQGLDQVFLTRIDASGAVVSLAATH